MSVAGTMTTERELHLAPGTEPNEKLTPLSAVVQRYFYAGPLSGSTARLADGIRRHVLPYMKENTP